MTETEAKQDTLATMIADVMNEYGEHEGFTDRALVEVIETLMDAIIVLLAKRCKNPATLIAALAITSAKFDARCRRYLGENT